MTSHQRRSRMPIRANGMTVGLSTASADGQHQIVPSATAAVAQMTGFPNTNLAGEYGHAMQAAMATQAHGAGRCRQTTQAMISAGMIDHSHGPTTRNGASRYMQDRRIEDVAELDRVRTGQLACLVPGPPEAKRSRASM